HDGDLVKRARSEYSPLAPLVFLFQFLLLVPLALSEVVEEFQDLILDVAGLADHATPSVLEVLHGPRATEPTVLMPWRLHHPLTILTTTGEAAAGAKST